MFKFYNPGYNCHNCHFLSTDNLNDFLNTIVLLVSLFQFLNFFTVIPKVSAPQHIGVDDRLIPQWAIAVIVIGVGGLLFIIVFGVSVVSFT